MADDERVGVDVLHDLHDAGDDLHAVVERARGLGADRAAGGEAHVRDDDVGAGLGHRGRLLLVEDVRAGEHVELVRLGDHVDLKAVAHAGLLEVLAEHAVDEAHGREVLHAVEALVLQLGQVLLHDAERVGAADAGENRGVLHDGQHLGAHLDDDLIRVAVGKQTRERAATGHAETAGVVDDEDVGAAGLSRLRRDARAGADAEQDVALGEGLTETIEDFRAGQFKHGVLLLFEYYLFLAEHMRSRRARELERTTPMKPREGAARPQRAR